jgi:hypothetical protein
MSEPAARAARRRSAAEMTSYPVPRADDWSDRVASTFNFWADWRKQQAAAPRCPCLWMLFVAVVSLGVAACALTVLSLYVSAHSG